ncbi:hypothetical protein BT63DRAFT_459027 [Microthyrium microscopicum]|uniref:Uncharacterized protein n=1 Tax=Microthyrium microscopicum TaxID=703497 RepID=A0A6A6U1H1_9PEZI|nr:hypothetical protein BT63DRAFT_459027 [Microthyrium microscopicum]
MLFTQTILAVISFGAVAMAQNRGEIGRNDIRQGRQDIRQVLLSEHLRQRQGTRWFPSDITISTTVNTAKDAKISARDIRTSDKDAKTYARVARKFMSTNFPIRVLLLTDEMPLNGISAHRQQHLSHEPTLTIFSGRNQGNYNNNGRHY